MVKKKSRAAVACEDGGENRYASVESMPALSENPGPGRVRVLPPCVNVKASP